MGRRPPGHFLTVTAAGQPQGCKDSIWASLPACRHSPPSSLARGTAKDSPGVTAVDCCLGHVGGMAGEDKGGLELVATVAAPIAVELSLFGSLTSRER